MTSARCGLLASMCLSGIGALPRCACVVVGLVPDDSLAAARPIADRTGSRQDLFRCRKSRLCDPIRHDAPSVVAESSPNQGAASQLLVRSGARGRNACGGRPHKPLPNADWGGGVLWVRPFWAQIEVVMTQASRPTVHPLRGLRLHHFGLKPDRSLGGASTTGPKTASMFASQVEAAWKGAHRQEGLRVHFAVLPS